METKTLQFPRTRVDLGKESIVSCPLSSSIEETYQLLEKASARVNQLTFSERNALTAWGNNLLSADNPSVTSALRSLRRSSDRSLHRA